MFSNQSRSCKGLFIYWWHYLIKFWHLSHHSLWVVLVAPDIGHIHSYEASLSHDFFLSDLCKLRIYLGLWLLFYIKCFFSQVIRFFKNVFLARLKLRGSEGEAIQMNLINCYRLDRLEIIFIFSTAF